MNNSVQRTLARRLAVPFWAALLTGCHMLPPFLSPSQPFQEFASSRAPALAPDARLEGAQSTRVGIRSDGAVTVNGQPFFPFGFYHVSWAWQGTPARRAQDIQRLAQAGFNVVVTEPVNDQDDSTFNDVLDQAQRAGVFVIPFGLSRASEAAVSPHPALLGFKVADDANVQSTPQQVAQTSARLHALNPDKLTYLSLAVAQDRPETPYFAAADIIGNQSYPIGNDDIGVTYRMMQSAVQSARAQGKVPVANLQTSFWGAAKPTPVEVRNMTYQTLLAGAKGIIYYAYRGPEVDMNAEPFLWRGLQGLAHEMAQLAPLLSDGELISLEDGPRQPQDTRPGGEAGPPVTYLRGQTSSGEWQGYVIAVNTSRKSVRTLDVHLPEAPTRWEPLGEDISEPGRVQYEGGRAFGQLAPLQVSVIRVR